jgi:signal transduction histidine kinase
MRLLSDNRQPKDQLTEIVHAVQVKLFYLIVLLLIASPQSALCQLMTSGFQREDCVIKHFTTDNGLPSNGITGLIWHEDGYLIMTTEAGIVRYNGQEILTDSLGIPFFHLIKSSENKLLAISRTGKIYEIKNGEICPYYFPNDYLHDRTSLYKLGTISLGLKELKESFESTSSPFPFIVRPEVYRYKKYVLYNGIGSLNICTQDAKTNLFSIPMNKETQTTPVFINQSPYLIDKNCLLQKIHPETGTTTIINIRNKPVFDKQAPILFFNNYGQKNTILIHKNKAWIFKEEKNGEISMQLVSECIPNGVVIKQCEYINAHQMLVLGTESNGLFILLKDLFSQNLPNKIVPPLGTAFYLQIPLNETSIITNNGYVINPKPPMAPNPTRLHEDLGHAWMKDSKGNLWYSQKDSIICFNPTTQKKECVAKFSTYAHEKKFFIEYKDTIYAATTSGLEIISQKKVIGHVDFNNNLDYKPYPGDIELIEDKIYISTCAGLFRYHPNTRTMELVFHLNNTCIRDIWPLKGNIFISTYGKGIFRITDKKIKKIPEDYNNYIDFAHCFLQDDSGYVWISTNRGIFRVSEDFLLKNNYTVWDKAEYLYFGKEDGVTTTEFNGGCKPCGIKLKESFSFPSMNGLIQFNPLEVHPGKIKYPIKIENILIGSRLEPWKPGNEILISPNEDLKIKFSKPWWGNIHNLSLGYQILGLNSNFTKLNYPLENTISINRLPPGKYTIKIFWIDDPYHPSSLELRLDVQTAWYKKTSGILALSLILGLFIWLFSILRINRINEQKQRLSRISMEKDHTVRTQKDHLLKTVEKLTKSQVIMEENNRMKNHVISILSHDLVTPLKYLGITGRGVLKNPENYDKEALLKIIQDITNTGQQLETLSSNILNWIKYFRTTRNLITKTFDLFEMVENTQDSLNMYFIRKGNTFYNNIPEGTFVTQISEPLGVILFNLVSNAIKYTQNGEISVDGEFMEDYFLIHVSDSGKGMTEDQVQKILKGDALESGPDTEMQKGTGLGYLIIRELVNLLKGELQIESEPDQGTTITLKLPMLKLNP